MMEIILPAVLVLVVLGLLAFGLFFPSTRDKAATSTPDDQPIPAPKDIPPPTPPSSLPKLVPAKIEPPPVKPLPPPPLAQVPGSPPAAPDPGPKLITFPPVAQPKIVGRTTPPPAPEAPPPKPSPAPKLPTDEKLPDFEGFCVACRVNTIAPAKTDFLCEACSVLPEFSVPIKSPISEKSSGTSTETKEDSPDPAALDESASGSAHPSAREVPVVSSNIKTVLYHPEYLLLQLRFHDGSVYWYFKVPPQIHKGLMEADSKGQFGHIHIYSAFSQIQISYSQAQAFWGTPPDRQREIIGSLLPKEATTGVDCNNGYKEAGSVADVDPEAKEEADDALEEEELRNEENDVLEELRQKAIEAVSDPVTDDSLILKDFFGWKDDFFSQADVNYLTSCLDYDPLKHADDPADRLAHCRDLIHGYPPSPIKLEVLIWMTRFADRHERFTDANNLLHEADGILRIFLENSTLDLRERFDFGMAAQELLADDIRETQPDPTFETDRLFSMLETLRQAEPDSDFIKKRGRRLLSFCRKVSRERFRSDSQDPVIQKNKAHLQDLINKLEVF